MAGRQPQSMNIASANPRPCRAIEISVHRPVALGQQVCRRSPVRTGAEVINIEPPEGDPLRQLTPFGREEYMLKDKFTGKRAVWTSSMRCATPEIRHPEPGDRRRPGHLPEPGQARWMSSSRSMPPGYMDSLGLGYRHLSKLIPRLVYLDTASPGHLGPLERQGLQVRPVDAGSLRVAAPTPISTTPASPRISAPGAKGGDPIRSGVWLADYVAGEQGSQHHPGGPLLDGRAGRHRPVHRVSPGLRP